MHKRNVTNSILSLRNRLWMLSLLFVLGGVATKVQAQETAAFSLIAHQSQDLQGLSALDVRRIFSGQKQQWPDGRKIKVFIMPTTSTLHRDFCRQQLKVFPYQLERLWNQLVFSGQGEAPEIVPDVATMREKVSATKGAIGYVSTGN